MQTQSSSEARLKNDTLGNDALKLLYNAFETHDIDTLKTFCKEMVMKGGGNDKTKLSICRSIDNSTTKSKIIKHTQDFILAGMGLGV